MTIDRFQAEALTCRRERSSHRTLAEQLFGLSIYLLISLAFEFASGLSKSLFGTIYFISLALGIWILWRSNSLRTLKLELSIFLSQFLFQILWSVSFFTLGQSPLALVALLLLWCNTLLAALLFWKKDRFSGMFFVFPLIWIFYLVGLNMLSCMSKS